MPARPTRVPPADMDARQWATYLAQSGIQADASAKSFPPTWTGFSVDPVGDISYYDFGKFVVLYTDANLLGTSDDAAMIVSDMPAAVTPSFNRTGVTWTINDNAVTLTNFTVTTGGTIAFGPYQVSGTSVVAGGSYASAGQTKGLAGEWFVVYSK